MNVVAQQQTFVLEQYSQLSYQDTYLWTFRSAE